MATYEKKIEELGKEIAEEIIIKEKDPKWETILDENSVSRSLSNIYNKDIVKVSSDLDREIRKSLSRIRNSN
jgi:U3 small nucleolar ribonucleoprotein component